MWLLSRRVFSFTGQIYHLFSVQMGWLLCSYPRRSAASWTRNLLEYSLLLLPDDYLCLEGPGDEIFTSMSILFHARRVEKYHASNGALLGESGNKQDPDSPCAYALYRKRAQIHVLAAGACRSSHPRSAPLCSRCILLSACHCDLRTLMRL